MYETTKDYNGCGDYGFFYPYYAEVIANDYCGDIVIPDKIHYSWVDSDDCYNIYYRDQDVVVKYIHSNAFAGCTNLTSITIPKSIISWGERYEPLNDPDYDYNLFYYREIPCSFRGCINLNSIIIDGDNEIYEVRNNCIVKKATNKLFSCYKSGSIDSSITSIGAHAFNLTGLTSIVIPESIQSIESSAFYYCSDLIYVQVLGSPNGGNVFYECNNLCYVEFCGDAVPDNFCMGNQYLKAVTIQETVKSIGSSAFSGCEALTSVTIPNSVISIGKSAFMYCI